MEIKVKRNGDKINVTLNDLVSFDLTKKEANELKEFISQDLLDLDVTPNLEFKFEGKPIVDSGIFQNQDNKWEYWIKVKGSDRVYHSSDKDMSGDSYKTSEDAKRGLKNIVD